MVSQLASQPASAPADTSNSHTAGLARSLTASQRVLTTLQEAHRSPKSPLGTTQGSDGNETSLAVSPGSAASGGVDVHFRLYQQSGSGSMERLLRRVALSGSALDKAFAEQQAGIWTRMLAPAADRDEVDSTLASLIDISSSPQYGVRTNGVPADPFVAAGPPQALAGVCIMQLQRTATDVAYCAAPSGESNTTDYRLFLEKEGQKVSPWHDVSLRNADGTVNFVCEIPKDTMAKMEVATVCAEGESQTPIKQDIKKGKLRFYPYNIHWNYGMLPQTWEDPEHRDADAGGVGGDDDPVDVVEIGRKQLRTGGVYCVKLLGAYAMIDEGELDWKVIAIRVDDPLAAKMDNVDDVEREMPGELERIMCWFRDYKVLDGKPANRYAYDAKALGADYARKVVAETHEFYLRLKAGTQSSAIGTIPAA